MSKRLELTGMTFGRLHVDSFAYTKDSRTYWNCTCACGKKCVVKGKYLSNGDTVSCGCRKLEAGAENGRKNKNPNKYEYIDDNTVKVFYNNVDDYFICDADDWERLKEYTWHKTEYGYTRTRTPDKKMLFFHDAVLNINPTPDIMCDHINRNRSDNRKSNLRIASARENCINRGLQKNNTSGATGVYLRKNGSYTVHISGKHLATTKNIDDAIAIRKRAEKEYYGEWKYDPNRLNR